RRKHEGHITRQESQLSRKESHAICHRISRTRPEKTRKNGIEAGMQPINKRLLMPMVVRKTQPIPMN
ncbi:MAG: hypothetical protein ABFE02_03555, partial [Sulfuricella sp.]